MENQRHLQRKFATLAENQSYLTENQWNLQREVSNMTDSQSQFRRQVAVLQSQVSEVIHHQVYLSEQKEPHKPFPLSPTTFTPTGVSEVSTPFSTVITCAATNKTAKKTTARPALCAEGLGESHPSACPV